MKIDKTLMEDALADISIHAIIIGIQLRHEEYVTILEFAGIEEALRFMASLAMGMCQFKSYAAVLASLATIETVQMKGRTKIRFRGWELT